MSRNAKGRPVVGNKRGIDVRDETLATDGSPRALKRRQTDQALSADAAAVRRAQTADRVRKSQKMSALRKTMAYQEADEATQTAMEEATKTELEKHRKATGQHATAKVPEAYYDSMDEFLTSESEADDDREQSEVGRDSRSIHHSVEGLRVADTICFLLVVLTNPILDTLLAIRTPNVQTG